MNNKLEHCIGPQMSQIPQYFGPRKFVLALLGNGASDRKGAGGIGGPCPSWPHTETFQKGFKKFLKNQLFILGTDRIFVQLLSVRLSVCRQSHVWGLYENCRTNQRENLGRYWHHERRLPDAVLWRHQISKMADDR